MLYHSYLLPVLFPFFVGLTAAIANTEAMADLVDTPSLVTKLLDVLPSLIYPPPRKLFCDVLALETKAPQAASPIKSKTISIRSVTRGRDPIGTSVSSWSHINSRNESITSGSIAGFSGFNSSSSSSSASDTSASDCILELHVHHRLHRRTYIIDRCALENLAFATTSTDGRYTLKSILEDATVPKVFFDVRMDSDALYGQYSIALAGVIDLQLMELASRTKAGWADGRVKELKRCLEVDANMKPEEKLRVQHVKDLGKRMFAPEVGGSYEVFKARPLAQEMTDYCVVDVTYMPNLFRKYNLRLGDTVSLAAQGH